MTTYLTIITTILVITQIIRITQNHISLFRQEKKIKQVCGWIEENDVSEHDFEVQREVYYMLHDVLKGRADMDYDVAEWQSMPEPWEGKEVKDND